MNPRRPAAVIILAAGQGTRMRSALPKVLHSMCGRSLLGHAIASARGLDPEYVVVVVRHERDAVAAHALACDPNVIIADQDEIKGTGRAVWCGLQALPDDVRGSVTVMAGDTPLLNTETLAQLNARHGDNAVTVLTTLVDDATGYGRILRDDEGVIRGVVEHRDASEAQREIHEINTSTYTFDADFLREALEGVSTSNAQGEMYLTDVVEAAYVSGKGVADYVVDDSWVVEGCNDLVQLATLRSEMNRRLLHRWMCEGASVIDPETTTIEVGVSLAPDCEVRPGTALRGTTRIATGAIVGPGELTNTVVGANARVCHVVADGAVIGEGQIVPPFSILPAGEAGSHSCGTRN
ncbi:NTP transferase domain-containing protein [Arcanobacterium haemolyticum]|nr:NTP transferase domain-containing protein [Arcanobacterium haemolyticum]